MKKRIKVLIVAASLNIGGAEKVARDIGLNCDGKRFEVHYLVFGDMIGVYEEELQQFGCTIIHMQPPSSGYARFMQTLRELIRQNQYDVVHAHTMFNIGLIMLVAWQEHVPVRIAHAHSALDDGNGILKLLYETVMRFCILRCSTDLIACGYAAGVRLYGEKTYKSAGRQILNGIDTCRFKFDPEVRKQMRKELLLEKSFVIGHVGHLSREKNQSFLVRLMPEILKCNHEAKLLLLGDGNDKEKLRDLVHSLNLDDKVIMTGNVRNVSDYLCAMDVFAFPSFYEGMPLSIIEVQANGLPCVLSTGVPNDVYLTDLVHPLPLEQPHAWIDAICAAERKESEKYSDLLKQSGFDTATVMKKYYEIYERADQT